MSENLNFTDTNLSSILALISDTAEETSQEAVYNSVHETYNFTGQLVDKYGLNDEPVGSKEYQEELVKIEASLKNKYENEYIDNTEIVDTIKNTDVISTAFSNIISIAEKDEQDFKNLGTIGVGTIAVEPVKDIKGQVFIKYVDENTNTAISERTFDVILNGQVVDGHYRFDAVPFKQDYLLKTDDFVFIGKRPKLIKINENRIGRVTLKYDYVSEKAGETIQKTVYRKIVFVDENDNPVDLSIIPTADMLNQTLTFNGTYNADGTIAWDKDTKFFDTISMQDLNNYLVQFGYKKTGPDVKATKALANGETTNYTETIKVLPLVADSVSISESTSVSTSESESESVIVSESETVKEPAKVYSETETRTVSFKLYGTQTKLHNNVRQTRVTTFELDNNTRVNENVTPWSPDIAEIMDELGAKYDYHGKVNVDTQGDIIFIFKDKYVKPKLSVEMIFDGVTAFVDTMPVDLISQDYAKYATIDNLMQHTYKSNGYNPATLRAVNKRYSNRMLENINKLRQSFGIRPLRGLIVDNDALDMLIGELSAQHTGRVFSGTYANYNFDVRNEDNLTHKNVIGFGSDYSPEALADYVLKQILYEANYVFTGDKEQWSHLDNLLNSDDLFIGLVYVGGYTFKEASDDDLPFSEIPKHIYNLSVSNKYILDN